MHMQRAGGRVARWLRMGACAVPCALLVGCGGKVIESVAASSSDPKLVDVVAFAEAETNRCAIPGGAIAVILDGKLVDYAGFGVRDDLGDIVTPETLFLTAGVSKAMVGAAALALSAKGQLSLDAPVTRYVPLTLAPGVTRADAAGVTMQTLLTHTSGLPDLDTGELSCATGPGALSAWFASDDREPLWTPPGEVWDFSQRGYAVAAWAIGAAADATFEDAMGALVFAPSGMTTATYEPAVVLARNHATGHFLHHDGDVTLYEPGEYDCAASRGADGIYASVLDDAHFVETLYAGGGSLLSAEPLAAFETGQVVDYLYPDEKDAYGMYAVAAYEGLRVLETTGDTQGYQAALWMVPDARFAVVVLFNGDTNASGCTPSAVAASAVGTYLGLGDVAPPDWQTPPSTWEPLLGTYYDPYSLGTITVTSTGSALVATTDAYGAVTLTQQSATAFVGALGDRNETVTFEPDSSGPAAWFVTRLGVGHRE